MQTDNKTVAVVFPQKKTKNKKETTIPDGFIPVIRVDRSKTNRKVDRRVATRNTASWPIRRDGRMNTRSTNVPVAYAA